MSGSTGCRAAASRRPLFDVADAQAQVSLTADDRHKSRRTAGKDIAGCVAQDHGDSCA
jgi:hypothetical protein